MTHHNASSVASLAVFIDGIGLLGPGLSSWEQGQRCFSGREPYAPQPSVLPAPMALPPAERRRAGAVIKVSLAVGQEAVTASGLDVTHLASVFSSSSGDAINCHEICSALASNDRLISPTRFHNSVHNASSGYWSISSGAMATSSVLCAHDASFSAGLLEAMTQVVIEDRPVLLVVYDTNFPEPMHTKRPVPDTFGVAMVLSPRRGDHSLAQMALPTTGYLTTAAPDVMDNAALELLRQSIPAARALPLLQAIARGQSTALVLAYLNEAHLMLEVAPC